MRLLIVTGASAAATSAPLAAALRKATWAPAGATANAKARSAAHGPLQLSLFREAKASGW